MDNQPEQPEPRFYARVRDSQEKKRWIKLEGTYTRAEIDDYNTQHGYMKMQPTYPAKEE